jgi:hypothetical protein
MVGYQQGPVAIKKSKSEKCHNGVKVERIHSTEDTIKSSPQKYQGKCKS